MNCEEAKRFLDAYLDRELDLRGTSNWSGI